MQFLNNHTHWIDSPLRGFEGRFYFKKKSSASPKHPGTFSPSPVSKFSHRGGGKQQLEPTTPFLLQPRKPAILGYFIFNMNEAKLQNERSLILRQKIARLSRGMQDSRPSGNRYLVPHYIFQHEYTLPVQHLQLPVSSPRLMKKQMKKIK